VKRACAMRKTKEMHFSGTVNFAKSPKIQPFSVLSDRASITAPLAFMSRSQRPGPSHRAVLHQPSERVLARRLELKVVQSGGEESSCRAGRVRGKSNSIAVKKRGASSFSTPLASVFPVVTSLLPRVASVSTSQSRNLSNLVHRVCPHSARSPLAIGLAYLTGLTSWPVQSSGFSQVYGS
jgi:hypothetical protein